MSVDITQGFPTFEIPRIVPTAANIVDPASIPFPKSWGFNFETGEIETNGSGRAVEVDGFRAAVIWIINAAITERYSCIIYGPQFGTEFRQALNQVNDATARSIIQRTINEALRIDPRVSSVGNFEFSQSDDSILVSFEVTTVQRTIELITLGFPTP